MSKQWLLVLLTPLVLFGCGGPKKLTPEQKGEFSTTLESAGRSQKLAKQVQRNEEWAGNHSAQTLSVEEKQMLAQLKAGRCIPKMTDGLKAQPKKMTDPIEIGFSIEGDGCPISFRFFTTSQMSETSIRFAMDMAYNVLDPEFKKLNDVYAMTLKGEVSGSTESGGGEFKGHISSQKHGDIPTAIRISGNKDHAEMTMTWSFPKYSVELKQAQTSSGKMEYSLNGEALTEKEFMELLSKGGDAFSQVGADKRASGGGED